MMLDSLTILLLNLTLHEAYLYAPLLIFNVLVALYIKIDRVPTTCA